MRKVKDVNKEEKEIRALDEGDIALMKTYGQGQYTKALKQVETDIQEITKRVNELSGIKESDTGLAPPAITSTPGKELRWSSILVPCIFISCSKKVSSGRLSLSVAATLSLCRISGWRDLLRPGNTNPTDLSSLLGGPPANISIRSILSSPGEKGKG